VIPLRKAARLLPRPSDYMWPMACHIHRDLSRTLIEMGESITSLPSKFAQLSRARENPNTRMLTPLVLEIIAEKL